MCKLKITHRIVDRKLCHNSNHSLLYFRTSRKAKKVSFIKNKSELIYQRLEES
jgi:hypothetical protein